MWHLIRAYTVCFKGVEILGNNTKWSQTYFKCVVHISPGHQYMQYLTLWGTISQNFALPESVSQKILNSHRIFKSSHFIDYDKIHPPNHIMCAHNIPEYIEVKVFESLKVTFWEVSQSFIKSLLKISLTSKISMYGIWHVCINGLSHALWI